MPEVVVELKHGIVVNGATHKRITIKTLTVGESLAAVDAAEKLVPTPNGYQLIASNARLMFFNVLKASHLTDDPDVVLTENVFKGLQGEDFDLLVEAAAGLDSAENRAMVLNKGGRD